MPDYLPHQPEYYFPDGNVPTMTPDQMFSRIWNSWTEDTAKKVGYTHGRSSILTAYMDMYHPTPVNPMLAGDDKESLGYIEGEFKVVLATGKNFTQYVTCRLNPFMPKASFIYHNVERGETTQRESIHLDKDTAVIFLSMVRGIHRSTAKLDAVRKLAIRYYEIEGIKISFKEEFDL